MGLLQNKSNKARQTENFFQKAKKFGCKTKGCMALANRRQGITHLNLLPIFIPAEISIQPALFIMRVILIFLFVLAAMPLFSQTLDLPDSAISEDKIFEKVDVEATFPGGEGGWRRYLEKNLNPNVPVENDAPIGIYTVIVQFIVDKNGNISDVKTLTNFGYGMEQEVLRIIRKGPSWSPASQSKRPVKAYRKQPITFVIEDDAVEIVMNEKYVLYTGRDNVIKINVFKVKNEDLEASLSQGEITRGADGNFHININNPGKAILYISSKKRNKEIGSVYFVVRKKN